MFPSTADLLSFSMKVPIVFALTLNGHGWKTFPNCFTFLMIESIRADCDVPLRYRHKSMVTLRRPRNARYFGSLFFLCSNDMRIWLIRMNVIRKVLFIRNWRWLSSYQKCIQHLKGHHIHGERFHLIVRWFGGVATWNIRYQLRISSALEFVEKHVVMILQKDWIHISVDSMTIRNKTHSDRYLGSKQIRGQQ